MQKRRATLLMAVLLGLVGFYIVEVQQVFAPQSRVAGQLEPLEGENEIRAVSIEPGTYGRYVVNVDYRFRGDTKAAMLQVYALQAGNSAPPKEAHYRIRVSRGENKAKLFLERGRANYVAHSTRIVRVEMVSYLRHGVIASKDIEYPIDWPRRQYTVASQPDTKKDVDTLYREAVAEIDYSSSESLENARTKLERIVDQDAGFVPVYPELARYYMKTNWGPEGLRQAERALLSGLAIDPKHASSHVLIGYVYAHQGRYQEAEDAFLKASRIGTENLWLFSNWGELFLMQGRVKDAIAMYRKAVAGERSYTTYDRARKDAYRHLIDIYRLTNDADSANEVHLQRIAEFSTQECYPYYFAKFRQRHFDDANTVLEYAKRALAAGCGHQESVRKVIGVAYYAKWMTAPVPTERQAYLTQARLYFAEGPELIYWLAQSGKTAAVIKSLVRDGTPIDIKDNEGLTALAYALKEDDMEAIKRIISMGANPNETVGQSSVSLLAIAVIKQNRESVIYLVENGADAGGQAYAGISLLEFAETMGYGDIAEVLKSAGGERI